MVSEDWIYDTDEGVFRALYKGSFFLLPLSLQKGLSPLKRLSFIHNEITCNDDDHGLSTTRPPLSLSAHPLFPRHPQLGRIAFSNLPNCHRNEKPFSSIAATTTTTTITRVKGRGKGNKLMTESLCITHTISPFHKHFCMFFLKNDFRLPICSYSFPIPLRRRRRKAPNFPHRPPGEEESLDRFAAFESLSTSSSPRGLRPLGGTRVA